MEFYVVLGIIVVLVGLFTNCFGLLGRSYKGTWVKIRYESMPEVSKRLQEANAFYSSDGIQDLKMKLSYEYDRFVYRIKVPEHVFHKVEFDLILKELKIK